MTDSDLSHPEARRLVRERANTMGINEAYIDVLVETFYARIRADAELGPIFNDRIKDNWPAHLLTLKQFWASVCLSAGVYSGNPMQAHMELKNVEPTHFYRWLAIFRSTLEDTAPSPGAVDYFFVRASRIASALSNAMFNQQVQQG